MIFSNLQSFEGPFYHSNDAVLQTAVHMHTVAPVCKHALLCVYDGSGCSGAGTENHG